MAFYIKAKLKRHPNEYTLVFYNILIGGTLGPVGPQESPGKQADFMFTKQKVEILTFYIKAKLKRQPNPEKSWKSRTISSSLNKKSEYGLFT